MRQMESSVKINRLEDKTIITIQGILDQELSSSLVQLVPKLEAPIVFDMKQVLYITAAGSRIILGYYQHFGAKPTLRHVNSDIFSQLTLTGTINYVTLAEDIPAPITS